MNELNQTILNECREEVAKRDYNTPFGYVVENGTFSSIMRLTDEAALLALDRQAEFYRWVYENYMIDEKREWFLEEAAADAFIRKTITELELYEIWREGK